MRRTCAVYKAFVTGPIPRRRENLPEFLGRGAAAGLDAERGRHRPDVGLLRGKKILLEGVARLAGREKLEDTATAIIDHDDLEVRPPRDHGQRADVVQKRLVARKQSHRRVGILRRHPVVRAYRNPARGSTRPACR